MPSSKNPVLVVIPGPGKLPAGTVTASALLFPPGGGGGAALSAHITDPVDAHMASAIGMNPLNAVGLPLLTTAGGVVDGESVLDFIDAVKDLFPSRPDYLGNDSITPNTGVPDWGPLDVVGTGTGTTITGGFERLGSVVYTRHLAPAGTVSAPVHGMLYPADRGVLAMYYSLNGDYSTGSLFGALFLGSTTPPAGIPPAGGSIFFDFLRPGQQADYNGSMVGLDQLGLTHRIAYLKDYTFYPSVPWIDFEANFPRYQVALFFPQLDIGPIASGNAGSWLFIHWKESYATTLASIQPGMIATQWNTTNCYSAVGADFDAALVRNTNRHNVFVDDGVVVPSGVSFTTAPNTGIGPIYTSLSGIGHYCGVALGWDINVQAAGLFDNSFYTGTVNRPNGPPNGWESQYDPLTLDLTDFGVVYEDYGFSQLRNPISGSYYSTAVPPVIGDTAELPLVNYSPVYATPTTPVDGYGVIKAIFRKPFVADFVYSDGSFRYLFNSYPQTGVMTSSTDTFEPFNDEKYRYISTYSPASPAVAVEPAGADHRDPTIVITDSTFGDLDAQVIGSTLRYPSVDYTSGYRPSSYDYAAVFAADALNWIRRYMRAFDTGTARNIGRLRIRVTGAGSFSQFRSNGPWTGNEVTDHSGGMIIQVKVPGATGWLDIGRLRGDPSLGTEDFKGCLTSVSVSGSDVIISYNTTEYTVDNGSGKYPLFVRVSYIKGMGGGEPIEEIEWLAP